MVSATLSARGWLHLPLNMTESILKVEAMIVMHTMILQKIHEVIVALLVAWKRYKKHSTKIDKVLLGRYGTQTWASSLCKCGTRRPTTPTITNPPAKIFCMELMPI